MEILNNKKGTMLIDILVAIGIVALLSSISIPYFRKYQPNLRLHASARNLTTDIRYAQQLTITEQKVHLVELNPIGNSYTILKIDTATTTIKSVNLDSDITFKSITDLSDNRIVFNFYGGVSQAGQIVLTNPNNVDAVINVKASGYIQLVE